MIISKKVKKEKTLSKDIIDTIALVKVAQVLSLVDLTKRYNWAMSDANLDIAKKLELTGIKKYWRRISQVEIKLDWLHN